MELQKGVEAQMPKRDQGHERRVKLEKALANPKRADILAKLHDSPSWPALIAKELGLKRQTVNYHINYLLEYDCIEEIDRYKVRGAERIVYRALETMYIGPETWRDFTPHERNGISLNIVNEGVERLQVALTDKTFDRRQDPPRIAGNWIMRLDDEGWRELFSLLMPVIERVKVMEGEAIDRHTDAAELSPFTLSIFAYESPRRGNGGRTRRNPPLDDQAQN